MSSGRLPPEVRRRVAKVSNYRCGYCLTSQRVVGPLLKIDHIIPEARGGSVDESNLWLACPLCNGAKADRLHGVDPSTGETIRLFNPRTDDWAEHFEWQFGGTVIAGLTAIGRSTVHALKLNRPDVVAARELWVLAGWHPPRE